MQSLIRAVLLVGICFVATFQTVAQDMHFTNYAMTPSFLNPALTGNFSGTMRAGLAFRTQHELVATDANATPFRTIGISADAPIIYGFKKTHWLGAGLSVMSDRVGIVTINADGNEASDPLTQSWNRFIPSVSYNIGLDKKFRQVVSIGVQYGLTSASYGGTDASTTYSIVNGTTAGDPDIMALENNGGQNGMGVNGNYGSINVGVTYRSVVSKTAELELGAAVMHLQSPTFAVPMGQPAPVYRRINIHGRYRLQSSKQLVIEPALYATFQGPQNNIQAQLRTEYKLKPKSDIALIAGLGYRLGDAPQFLTGARYKDWLISLSYDYALTDASDISPHKIELGATKIFTVNKRPEVTPTLYCPRM